MKIKTENFLHKIFEIGIGLKFFNGIWEIASGFILAFAGTGFIDRIFRILAHKELIEDPNDFIVRSVAALTGNIDQGTAVFIISYIFIHGLINIFLAVELYRGRIRAYLVSIAIMCILILYQILRVWLHHSVILAVITFFDILFAALTWHEYKIKKAGMSFGA